MANNLSLLSGQASTQQTLSVIESGRLDALLNTIPMEITFVDGNNINRYFNEGPKVFKRPGMAIDREVFSCHPPKIEPMVGRVSDVFKII